MKKTAADRPNFAPIPLRAMSDKTLSAEHIRVLMAIAAHDRFGKNGIGCYATHRTLATIVGCHIKSLSRSIALLVEHGYISDDANPLNRKLRVYKVIYTDADALTMKPAREIIGNKSATCDDDIGNDLATDNGDNGNNLVPIIGPIGNKPKQITHENQLDTASNIFSETDNKSSQTEIHSTEVASSLQEDAGQSVEQFLAILDRAVQRGHIQTRQMHAAMPHLENIMDTEEFGTPNYGRAYRLHEQIGFMLEDANVVD